MKRTITALTIAASLATALALGGCATAKASQDVGAPETPGFASVQDKVDGAIAGAQMRERLAAWHEAKEAEAAKAAEEAQAAQMEEQSYGYDSEYDPYLNNNPEYLDHGRYVQGNPDGLNSFDGTYSFNGHEETYYASYAVYDDQLWVDDDGFFRTDDGKYVVSTDDYEQGTVIEISQGEAVVMDGGTDPGVVDVHTTWGR